MRILVRHCSRAPRVYVDIVYRPITQRDDRGTRDKSAGRGQTVHAELGSAIPDRRVQVTGQVLAGDGRQRFRGGGAQGAAQLRHRRRAVPVGDLRQGRRDAVQERQRGGRRAGETRRVESAEVYQRGLSQPVQGAFSHHGTSRRAERLPLFFISL